MDASFTAALANEKLCVYLAVEQQKEMSKEGETMRCRSAVGVLVVLGLGAVGCQPQPMTLLESDRAAIRQAADSWVKNVNAKDFGAVASVYAEDAVLLPPNSEVVQGRTAIQSFLASFPPASFQAEQVEIEGRSDFAYVRGTYSITFTVPAATTATTDRGKYIEIWRKQADGSWKLTRDIFNSDLALPKPEPSTATKKSVPKK